MSEQTHYESIESFSGTPIKAWTRGVPFAENARRQVENVASLPFIHGWVAVMPDVHWGMGATVGSVIPTVGAIIPAAVGVDIGCGMMALQTTLTADDLPDNLSGIRSDIERAVPHGRSKGGGRGDSGSWQGIPNRVERAFASDLADRYQRLVDEHRALRRANCVNHLGTLGTGNHFIELCLDEANQVWVMLHSGSRGIGNRIGNYFIEKAKNDMKRLNTRLPDNNLAYFTEGTEHFRAYVEAVEWAQDYARLNRELMMDAVLRVLHKNKRLPGFQRTKLAVNCHHNYVTREVHFDKEVWVTRKGAVRAGEDELGIIPGSMGARSFIVRGKGNAESFHSCSHGAGRVMSRGDAKKSFTLKDHREATKHVECRKDKDVLDETPGAYKDIDKVMAAQSDLVDIVHTLRQVVCVKG